MYKKFRYIFRQNEIEIFTIVCLNKVMTRLNMTPYNLKVSNYKLLFFNWP